MYHRGIWRIVWAVWLSGIKLQIAEGSGEGSLTAQDRGYMDMLAGTTVVMSRSLSREEV